MSVNSGTPWSSYIIGAREKELQMLFNNQSFYPIIKTENFDRIIRFYADYFDFHPCCKDDRFTILQRDGADKQYIGILSAQKSLVLKHEVKEENVKAILSFEVENIRLAYQQFHWMGAELLSDIQTTCTGHKIFVLRDPDGNYLTVVESSAQTPAKQGCRERSEACLTGTH